MVLLLPCSNALKRVGTQWAHSNGDRREYRLSPGCSEDDQQPHPLVKVHFELTEMQCTPRYPTHIAHPPPDIHKDPTLSDGSEGIRFNALDAMKVVNNNEDLVKVRVVEAWKEARSLISPRSNKTV